MNAKEFVQIVKKMFSKGLTPEEKIKLADEGPTLRMYVGITNLQRKNCQAIIGVLGFWLPPLVFCWS